MEAADLSSRGLARLLRVDNRMLRRWRKGTRPDPGHLTALFNLAAEMRLLHILLPAIKAPVRRISSNRSRDLILCSEWFLP